ncbi:hypothetical protein H8K90_06035 [Winogradskyella echinorum]|uniref:Uncharacterized protein n=1 Tax=Winogradskyella echinorum TaxID=538189 RepID=A0ABR6Y0X7_9FLAO|nr:DUF6090 family protein [Winogradskyella echinorum]MBC3845930.1 hypothetical protein [Winogradskyella echinorum]MBC5750278.1 hypothetical protein [Winogradskyella echinorum]
MIKFFRKIRQNLLSEGKTGKYFKYAVGEIVLVVIGILIALQLNNLNDERKTENLRQVYYEQLLQDFEKDKAYIKEHSSIIDSNMVKVKAFKEIYNQPNQPIFQIISESTNLDWAFRNVQFKSNTISTLENTGDVKLIPPNIREKLISLEKYKEETENVSKYNNDRAAIAEFNASQIYGSVDFVFENIKNQPKLLEWVFDKNRQIELLVAFESSQNNKVNSEKSSLTRFKKILSDMEEIEILINKELKK